VRIDPRARGLARLVGLAGGAVACATLGVTLVAQSAREYVTLCTVHFVVRHRDGTFVTNLARTDVRLTDNGRPQVISEFERRVQAPVRLALIVDRSGSLRRDVPAVLDAAGAFVTSVIRSAEDVGELVAFDAKVYLLQDWTNDPARLVDRLHTITAAGGTSMFDALYKTCRDGFQGTDARQDVVVLVTDGEDTTSAATFDDALRMAQLAHVSVYVLGVRAADSLNSRELQGRRVLTTLATLTGGRVLYPSDFGHASLAALFGRLQEELRNGYVLSYYLDVPPDNAFHRVRIQPLDPSLRVQAPSGYFADRRPFDQ
jgi:VWFA-related protein